MSNEKTPPTPTIKTLDGREMEKSMAKAVNPDRLWFVSKLLRERLGIDKKADVKALIQASAVPERTANLKLVNAAEALLATINKKGLAGFAIADTESSVAQQFTKLLAAPDVSNPPKSWGTFNVPDLFTAYDKAEEKWFTRQAEHEAQNAEHEAKKARAREEAEKIEREAKAERERQAVAKSEAADALFAFADSDVVSAVAEEREKKTEADTKAKAAKDARLAKTKEFFRKLFRGEVSALGYKTKSNRWYVSRNDNDFLSRFRIAELAGADPMTEVYSAVDGSMFAGHLGDTHISGGKTMSNWMVAMFTVKLRTEDGRPTKETATGYLIMDSHEGTTLKIVAQELDILDTNDEDSQKAFWEKYRLQALAKASEYEAMKITRREDEKNGRTPPTPEPEPNNKGSDQPRNKKTATPRRKSNEDGKSGGRPEHVPELKLEGGDEESELSETPKDETPAEPIAATGITVGNEDALTHSPFAILAKPQE